MANSDLPVNPRLKTAGLVVRWTARIASLASIAMLIAFIGGSVQNGDRMPNVSEALGFAFFPVGVMTGMLIAWRYELAGGLVTMLSLAGFYVWHLTGSGDLATGPWFLIFASPGLLFVVSWVLNRKTADG